MYSVWLSMANKSTADESYKQVLANMEADGKCCGFGSPERCSEERVPSVAQNRYLSPKCGDVEGWYQATPYCRHLVNGEVRGCRFDNPVSPCKDKPVVQGSRGCAVVLREWAYDKVWPSAVAAALAALFQCTAVCASCLLCYKRKERDVLPAIDPDARPPKPRPF